MKKYLPRGLASEVFAGQTKIKKLTSSYKIRGYDYFFYALTRVLKPVRCVEIGVLQGFSLLTIASALRDNGIGLVEGFDLFEKYPFRNERFDVVTERLRGFGLHQWAKIYRVDAFEVHDRYQAVDLLHVDISNDGEVYRKLFNQWAGKVAKAIIFEGGSSKRDEIPWMAQYHKHPITEAVAEIRAAYPSWEISVLDPYPSITVALPATE
ncbi:MAG: class I SAM-dependent methyltransferase [Acidobacteria bacterium]|nr:class I SAM-dependent methyltransferase [Acidobacteriota bacterium]